MKNILVKTSSNPSRKPAAVRHAGGYLFLLVGLLAMRETQAACLGATNTPAAIPWSQIGAKAGANYQGDGLAVTPDGEGARLHCVFQRLDGEATSEGLWLTSTVTNTPSERFRVTAAAVGRVNPCAPGAADRTANSQHPTTNIQLEDAGIISLAGQTVRFSRPGLVEEYSVSMDGVRQDFLVPERPAGAGELAVRLAVSGARVEPAAAGVRLMLDNSGRKVAYSRLRATDATGKELPARIEVADRAGKELPAAMGGEADSGAPGVTHLALVVVVNDAAAVYPVRIDPTFSDANWISMGGVAGVLGHVDAVAVDGTGNVYIGGTLTAAGDTIVNNIAKWDGSRWSALGSGMNNQVSALAVSGSTLYAGGFFTTAGGVTATNIAQWDGSSWSSLGSGINGGVSVLAVSGSTLYVGGGFSNAGGVAATNIAQWNGNSWSALGSGMNSGVGALAVSGNTLYAAGNFTTAGRVAASCVAKWDGSSWSALGSGISGGHDDGEGGTDPFYVNALAVSGDTLYACGFFTTAGGIAANNIAQWNGSSWSALGSGINAELLALAVSGSDLYVGGQIFGIMKWDGSSWSALGSGISGGDNEFGPIVNALAVSGSDLYVGGDFSMAGGDLAYNVAQWNESSWSALGSGMDGKVLALAVSGSTLYAGGDFTTVLGIAATNVVQWNGSSWLALGSGMDEPVSALAVSGTTLYAGGGFTTAGGVAANSIAQWNGSSWSALGSGMSGGGFYVSALAVSGSKLYAGGWFTTAGGNSANSIAQWNGSSWSALGSGMSGTNYNGNGPYVYALAVSGSTLYAGGSFTKAGGKSANSIAQWNGSSWSALGSGLSDGDAYGPYVSALAVSGSTLYVGGDFTSAGSSSANYIAQWNGSSWSALGSGMSGINNGFGFVVNALAVSGSTLYAGGDFTSAGGIPANSIAKWNGSSWSALGSGMSGGDIDDPFGTDVPYVNALAVSGTGNDLYVGGQFTLAGGKVSVNMARANSYACPR